MKARLFVAVALATLLAWSHGEYARTPTAPAVAAAPEISAASLPIRATTVVASINLNPLAFNFQAVACPSGMVALAGGIDAGNVNLVYTTSSGPTFSGVRLWSQPDGTNPAPDGWQASAYNSHATNTYTIAVAVICAPASSVNTVVASINVNPLAFNFQAVQCPAGRMAVGGGIDVGNLTSVYTTSSAPTFSGVRLWEQPDGTLGAPDGWQASAYNSHASSTYSLKVAAICAPAPGVSTIVASINVNPLAFNFQSVACPAGGVAVGGGIDAGSLTAVYTTSSGPTFSGVRLWSQPDGTGPAPDGWQASAHNSNAGTPFSLKVAVACNFGLYLPTVER